MTDRSKPEPTRNSSRLTSWRYSSAICTTTRSTARSAGSTIVWRAKIGDPWNGYRAEKDGLLSLGQAARWLCDQALHHFPDSQFAKEYLRSHPGYLPIYEREEAGPSP